MVRSPLLPLRERPFIGKRETRKIPQGRLPMKFGRRGGALLATAFIVQKIRGSSRGISKPEKEGDYFLDRNP